MAPQETTPRFGFQCSVCGTGRHLEINGGGVQCSGCGTTWSTTTDPCPYCATISLFYVHGRLVCRKCGRYADYGSNRVSPGGRASGDHGG